MASSRYDAGALTVDQMLAPNSAVFQIPTFQRRYAWEPEEVAELLGDLYGDSTWTQDNTDNNPYFLGSIVLSKVENGPNLVLDGQQRLTTISLLLSVLKHKLTEHGHPDTSSIQTYLEAGQIGRKKTAKLQLQPEDRELFAGLISDPSQSSTSSFRRSVMGRAVQKINEMIDEYMNEASRRGIARRDVLELMVQHVLYSVEFVRIVAPSESEAFRLFETLNDRGLPLSAADLIKNKLFAQGGSDYLNDIKEAWQDTMDVVGLSEAIHFLRYFWIATQSEVRKDALYDVFHKSIGRMKPSEANEFAKKMRLGAELYRHIAEPNPENCPWGSDSGESLQRTSIFRARSCRTALLACALYSPRNMPLLIKIIESITVRYSVVGEHNPNQLERSYGSLCRRIKQEADQLNLQKAIYDEIKYIPSDQEFEQQFSAINVDKVTNTWREILSRINSEIATGETRILGGKYVHVEHILPKNPSRDALTESGLTVDQVEIIVGSIGNLTLLSGRKNREISNGPFSRKQPVFASSEIKLNQWIAKRERWTIEDIEERSRELAKLAVHAWQWPV